MDWGSLLALFRVFGTPLCLRPSFLDLDSVPCAWLVTILLKAALHQVLRVLSEDVSGLSSLRPSVHFFKLSCCLLTAISGSIPCQSNSSKFFWISSRYFSDGPWKPEINTLNFGSPFDVAHLLTTVISPRMFYCYHSFGFYANMIHIRNQLVLKREYFFAWLLPPPTLASNLFDRNPIPLNLNLCVTLWFFPSSFCIPWCICLLQPRPLFQEYALMLVYRSNALPTWLLGCSVAVY